MVNVNVSSLQNTPNLVRSLQEVCVAWRRVFTTTTCCGQGLVTGVHESFPFRQKQLRRNFQLRNFQLN